MITLEQLHRALGGEIIRGKTGRQVRCAGPGHSAGDRSLAVAPRDNGDGFVVHSFAGDETNACKDFVRGKLGLPLFGKGNGKTEQRILATYEYLDEAGKLLYQVLRFEPKDFRNRRPDGAGGWLWKLDGVRRVPYRLPELVEALANERPIFVVEGEKDADALWALKIPATCNPHGAGKWREEYSEHFKGATVYVIPDNDQPEYDHAQQVEASISAVATAVKIVKLPCLREHGDVSDWLSSGGTPEALYALVDATTENETPRGPKLLTSAAFVEGFMPPDYLIEGILQRRFIYSITGRTGEGKTTVCLRIAAHVAKGLKLIDAEVTRGRVLYLAGENPDDIRMRWIVLMEQMGLDETDIAVDFVDGRFQIAEIPQHILTAASKNEYALVIVDTSVAFSQSIDENDNVEQLKHAQALRSLIDKLPGDPTILVCCHPPKNADDNNLQPRGGGAAIAEFDGNLTCRRTDTVTEIHHQGKFRGPDFAPMHFTLEGASTARLKDSRGTLIWSVFAKPASEQDQEEISKALQADFAAIMAAVRDEPGLSLTQIARCVGWHTRQNLPDKSKVQKRVRKLESKKLVERDSDRLELTDKGRKWLEKIQGRKQRGHSAEQPHSLANL